MLTRRHWLALAAATALLATSACGGDDEGDATEEPADEAGDEEGDGDGSEDEQEPVTLSITWWGDDDRANRYEEAVDLFEAEYPHITVNTAFSSWPDYWPARATEAAGSSLPDVMQMDLSFLRQYAAPGQLLALEPYISEQIDTSGFEESLLTSLEIDGSLNAIPIGTNAFSLFYNPEILDRVGVDPPAEILTWDEYNDFIVEVSGAGGSADPQTYGSADYTGTFWIFIHWLNQNGKQLFTDDGQLAITEDDMREWWNKTADVREATLPQERATQLEPLSGFAATESASEMTWDNFLAGYLFETEAEELVMQPIPSDDPDNLGLFLKPSMMLSVGANTEHPEEAAMLVDFLVNSPDVGAIFGTSRGLPASSTQRDGLTLEGVDAQVAEYEESVSEYLTQGPPPPVEGFGTLEENFRRLGQDVRLGAITVDDAVDQWFTEAGPVLNN